ncbi:Ataxin-2 [Nymphon striatum]|nr:Ataxin-2 [Nymphon striatum]
MRVTFSLGYASHTAIQPSRHNFSQPYPTGVATEGIYGNPRCMNTVTALVGCKGVLQVKSGQWYEGIFHCFSSHSDIVMSMVTEFNPNNGGCISSKEKVVEKMIFNQPNIIQLKFTNVDLEYATKESFATDSVISKKANGKVEERELEPWDDPLIEGEDGSTAGLAEDSGWDVNEMFKTNQDKYGVTSTYDSSLAGYTVALEKKDTEDYRTKEERASKIACEIESSVTYKQRIELENGDEEERFSAVVRVPERPDNYNSTNARFYQSNKKKSGNKVFQRPSSQPNHSVNTNSIPPPMKVTIPQRSSPPTHSSSRSNSSLQQQPPHPIRSKPPYCPPHVDSDPPLPTPNKLTNDTSPPKNDVSPEKKTVVSPSEKVDVPVPKVQQNSPPQQQQPHTLPEKTNVEKTTSNSSHKSSKNEEIACLKKFSNDFDIEQSKSEEAATGEPAPTRNEAKTSEAEDKMAATVKNSILNPNAKEFNPTARSFTPNSTMNYSRSPQTPTPPSRQQASQSPVIPGAPIHFNHHQVMHPMISAQQPGFTSIGPGVAGQPQQFMVAGQAPVNVSLAPPFNSIVAAMPQNTTRYRKGEDRRGNADMKIGIFLFLHLKLRIVLNFHLITFSLSSVHVAAATGQPLLAPAAAASLPGAKYVQYQTPQGIVTGGPGAPQPTMVSYPHPPQMYPTLMGPRMFNHQTMTMVPTSQSVSGVSFEQHGGLNSQIYCMCHIHARSSTWSTILVSLHGIVNHSTAPTQSQSTTPAGAGVHPSPSPVHHQGNPNQPNGVPPQPVVYHPGGQMHPGSHMQANAPNHSNGHQHPGNPGAHLHLSHGNAAIPPGNQHPVTFHSTAGNGPQHMVLLPQVTATGSQPVIHTSSARSLQASHMHGPNNQGPGIPTNAVIPHHGNTISVLATQPSPQLHYLPQQHSQPATGYQHNQ